MIDIQPDDIAFDDSPDAGPGCFCSRCGQVIPKGVEPIRMGPPNVEEDPREWRYHPRCQGLDDADYPEETEGSEESDGDEWKR